MRPRQAAATRALRLGLAAWPSDGFARHVLVDDLGWLLCLTLAGVPLFFLGDFLRTLLPAT